MQIGLLDYLAGRSGYICLSDLRRRDLFYRVRYALMGIEPKDFAIGEWNEAVTYITGEEISFPDEEQAAAYLKNYQF